MTQYAKDKFPKAYHITYTLEDVNLTKLQNALDKHDLMHPLGINTGRMKIGKKQAIEVTSVVTFYFNGVPIFHKTRIEIINYVLGFKNGKFKNDLQTNTESS